MSAHVDNPFVTLAIALVAQAIAAYVGDFLRIADLDSLRGGVIRVQPQNLGDDTIHQTIVAAMSKNRSSSNNRLQARRVIDVPLREVSGISLRRGRAGRMSIVAVGDHAAKVAWFSLPRNDEGRIIWQTSDIAKLSGSLLPKRDSQIEAVCADGLGRVLLLQETPPRVELIDLNGPKVVASIDLVVEGHDGIGQAWSRPKGSRGEGMALLPGGHLLVAKEKKPAALIEFGPVNSRSRGLVRGGALPDGKCGRSREAIIGSLHSQSGFPTGH